MRKFLKFYLAAFVVLGSIAYMTLHETAPLKAIESNILGERDPASIGPNKKTLKSTEILKVGCSDREKEIPVSALQVRVDGSLCKSGKKTHLIALENQTTGQPAILFQNGSDQFTTDYIQLKSGRNEMSLTYSQDNHIQKMDFVFVQ